MSLCSQRCVWHRRAGEGASAAMLLYCREEPGEWHIGQRGNLQVCLRQGKLASQRVGDCHAEQPGPFGRQNVVGGILQGNGLLRLVSECLQGGLVQGGIGLRVQHIVATFDAEKMLTELKAGEMAMDPGTRGTGRHADMQTQTSGLGKIIVDSRQDSLSCNEGVTALALLRLDSHTIDSAS